MAATLAPDTLFTLAALDAPTVRLAMAADTPATTAAYAPFDFAADAPICSERSLIAITQAAACAPHVIRQCLLTLRHWMAAFVVRVASTVIGNTLLLRAQQCAPSRCAVLADACLALSGSRHDHLPIGCVYYEQARFRHVCTA
jgi:hypothetical protein